MLYSRRQEDGNNVDVGDACREKMVIFPDFACAVMSTYSTQADIFSAIVGQFNLQEGDYLAHYFEGSCDHKASANWKPQSPGFEAKFEHPLGTITAKTECFGIICHPDEGLIGGMTFGTSWTDGLEDDKDWGCFNEEEFVDGLLVYGYRLCQFPCL